MLRTIPTSRVRPLVSFPKTYSRAINRNPGQMYSAAQTNCSRNVALSPIRTTGRSSGPAAVSSGLMICIIFTVWRTHPACNTIHDPTESVAEWYRQSTSASNARTIRGAAAASTIPFRTCDRRTRLSARHIECPATAESTLTRLQCIDRTVVVINWLNPSGPSTSVSPTFTVPEVNTPETTVPTNGTLKMSLIGSSTGPDCRET